MAFSLNKKSLAPAFLAVILLSLAAFLIILSFVPQFLHKAEANTAEGICALSVKARDLSYTEIRDPKFGLKLGSVATPLACKTVDKYVPGNKEALKEEVEREIATLLARCWQQFGEGLVKDVFKKGDQFSKNCFVCYTLSLGETPTFKELKSADLLNYMFNNPYKATTNADFCKINGGYCIDSENKEGCYSKIGADSSYILIKNKDTTCSKKGKNSCCYTEYGCWNKGGKCDAVNPNPAEYSEYSDKKWNCPPKMKCYIKKDSFYSYGDYIQRFGGPGNIIITTDLKPGETYAVSFGSPTEECAWCTKWASAFGLGGAVVLPVLAIAFAPATLVAVVGVGTLALVGGVGGYSVTKVSTESINSALSSETLASILGYRNINTIYLSTLAQLQDNKDKVEYCNVVKDVSGK